MDGRDKRRDESILRKTVPDVETVEAKIVKKVGLIIKTKRLELYPLSDREIQKLIDNSTDESLTCAYSQMLLDCKNNPTQREWYAPWAMETKEGNHIGELGFRGPASDHSVEIGYGINKEYEGQGYVSEAAEALINWAFSNEDILFVEAEADENNAASIHVLEKIGFKQYGYGEEGPRFVKAKPDMSYTSIGMCLGLCFGLSIGMLIFDNMTMGMCTGLAIGTCFGSAKDNQNKAKMSIIMADKYGQE